MNAIELHARVAKLETEVASLKVRTARLKGEQPRPIDVIDSLRTCFTPEDVAAHDEMMRFVRQYRDSEREVKPSAQLQRLRSDYQSLIRKLRKAARFKSNTAAAEFAHREFSP